MSDEYVTIQMDFTRKVEQTSTVSFKLPKKLADLIINQAGWGEEFELDKGEDPDLYAPETLENAFAQILQSPSLSVWEDNEIFDEINVQANAVRHSYTSPAFNEKMERLFKQYCVDYVVFTKSGTLQEVPILICEDVETQLQQQTPDAVGAVPKESKSLILFEKPEEK